MDRLWALLGRCSRGRNQRDTSFFDQMPDELKREIFSLIDLVGISDLSHVNRATFRIARDCWRQKISNLTDVEISNFWRTRDPLIIAANFRRFGVDGINIGPLLMGYPRQWCGTNLSNISFVGTGFHTQAGRPWARDLELRKWNFEDSDFSQAVFDHCTFKSCNFKNCNFSQAVFDQCYFEVCCLENSNFTQATFIGSGFWSTNLSNVNFSFAKFTDGSGVLSSNLRNTIFGQNIFPDSFFVGNFNHNNYRSIETKNLPSNTDDDLSKELTRRSRVALKIATRNYTRQGKLPSDVMKIIGKKLGFPKKRRSRKRGRRKRKSRKRKN